MAEDVGTFVLSGNDILVVAPVLCATGSFTLAGMSVNTPRVMPVAKGAFVMTGVAVLAPGEAPPHTATCDAGAFTFTGCYISVQHPGGVSYAEIVDGRVVAVSSGPKPVSTADVLYIDLTGVAPTPAVNWYFLEVCRDFSETVPVPPPGSIAPPYPPAVNPVLPPWTPPPTTGGPGPVDPAPIAWVVPTLIPFHATT